MELYKYVKSERIDILKDKMISFTKPDSFNDPFEVNPFFKGFASFKMFQKNVFCDDFKKKIRNKVADGIGFNIPNEFVDQFFKENLPLIKHSIEEMNEPLSKQINSKFQENFSSQLGVLSLTEEPDNLLMWSHYSDSHSGFVIKFDTKHSFFTDSNKLLNEIFHLTKIKYLENRPNLFVMDKEILDVLFQKGNIWEYEKEWRLCKSLEKASKTINVNRREVYLFKFPPTIITEIILGSRISLDVAREIKHTISNDKTLQHITIKRAIPDKKEYKLYFKEE